MSTTKKPMSIAEYVQRVVDEAPPLTAEQRDRLALLLRPSTQRLAAAEPETLDDLGIIFRGHGE